MSTQIFRKPVGGPRIVPFGVARQQRDVLSNGHPAFRVTQSFNHFDAIFRNRIHGAMDIGNFYCGDRVVAMGPGTVTRLRDPNGALGVRVSHPNGYKTEVWHLSRYKATDGSQTKAGNVLGYVGSSGLDIGGCHVHVVVIKPDGQITDPWPLIRTGN